MKVSIVKSFTKINVKNNSTVFRAFLKVAIACRTGGLARERNQNATHERGELPRAGRTSQDYFSLRRRPFPYVPEMELLVLVRYEVDSSVENLFVSYEFESAKICLNYSLRLLRLKIHALPHSTHCSTG